jgi:putative ABC transport system ATP-binding protein
MTTTTPWAPLPTDNTTQAVLAGVNLHKSFGPTEVLRGVSLDLKPGEVVALMGPSGSGKSTALHILAGLMAPDSGAVFVEGERIDQLSERKRSDLRLAKFGFVFQFGDIIPELTLLENVAMPLRLTGTARTAAERTASDCLGLLGVADQANRRVSEVSGGQAQRAAVARALVHNPAVILADEPTGSLDTVTGELVLEALVGCAKEQGTAVLLVTHELKVAAWSDRDVLLRDGAIVAASATPAPAAA